MLKIPYHREIREVLKNYEIKMNLFLRSSSQYLMLQKKPHPMSTEFVSNAADGILS